jgi:tetratricopeptide (TPR) repeat protein
VSVDRTKVLEAAQKHLAKGNYDKAILELRKIVDADPSDVRTLLRIGDLYTRKGANLEAIETYGRVATVYGHEGHYQKALAVYKQILKLDPSRLDMELRLAAMYDRLNLKSEAIATYEHVAVTYARAGQSERALAALAKTTEVEPGNIPVRIKYAEALSKAGRANEAAEAFEVGAALLKSQGRIDDFMKVSERLLYHRPDDVPLALELAELYLERRDAKHALAKLQACFKVDAKNVRALGLLAQAFAELGQVAKTISVYREVARIHQDANRVEERAQTLRRILELDPADAEARQGLASLAVPGAIVQPGFPPGPGSRADSTLREPSVVSADGVASGRSLSMPPVSTRAEPLEEPPGEEELASDIEFEDEAQELIEVEEALDDDALGTEALSADLQRDAQIARLLTECDVFSRYGLKQKVMEQLRAVIELDARHVEARERLKEAYLAQGDLDGALSELVTLADILATERSAAAVLYLREALAIDPTSALARTRLARLTGRAEDSSPAVGLAEEVDSGRAVPADAEVTPADARDEDEVFFVDDGTDEMPVVGERQEDEGPATIRPPASDAPEWDTVDGAATRTSLPSSPPLGVFSDLPPAPDSTSAEPAVAERPDAELADAGLASAGPAVADVDALSNPVFPRPPRMPTSRPPSAPNDGSSFDLHVPFSPAEFHESVLPPADGPSLRRERVSTRPHAVGDVEELLEEADFFVAQGLFAEALAVLNDALQHYRGHPLIQEKLRDVEELAVAASAERIASRPAPAPDHVVELANELAAELVDRPSRPEGSDVLDVERVFAQSKDDAGQQVAVEDSATHFDLGIAYKEMGLVDDAIHEFELCLSDPARICVAQTMIGICHVERGDAAKAIAHFKKGLYADTKTEREELGLYFELGNAHDLLQDPKEALYYFQKVQKRDPGFRAVGDRIQALMQPKAPPPPAPRAALDDLDAAFDDLMSDD